MDQYLAKDFTKLLKNNAVSVRRQMLNTETDVMRIYDQNLVELPVTVDLYGNWARITDYSDSPFSEQEIESITDIVCRMAYVEKERVIFHRREKRVAKEQHETINKESLFVTVKENTLLFKVDLTKRIDTGLFLDQMVVREVVKSISTNLRVLNLFSYTGSFSVYAASGGAKRVTSVDLSATYCSWCKENLQTNLFGGDNYPVVNGDALQFIQEAIQKKEHYDLIIFDPPTFSNSNKAKDDFNVQKDYLKYIHLLNALLVKEGKLLFSVNFKNFVFDTKKIDGYDIIEITKDILAPGFSAKRSSLRSWILTKKRESKRMTEQREKRKKTPHRGKDNFNQNRNNDDFVLNYDDNGYTPKRDLRDYQKRDERPKRDYQSRDNRAPRERREYQSRDDRPRRDYQSRDDRAPRERREYQGRDERPRRDDQSPRRDFQSRDDRPRRDYQSRDDRAPRERREYQGRDERPRRDDQTPRRDYQSREERPRRDFQDREQRPRRDYQDREQQPSRRTDGQRPREAQKSRGPKVYGYDRFKERGSRSKPQRDEREEQ